MKVTTADVGCWLDSARGRYIVNKVIDLAIDNGFDPKTEEPEDGWIEYEFVDELQDEAEEYLNQFAPDGCYFGSNENCDWGLWQVE